MSRVLVIRGGALGDFLLTLPAIHLLGRELDAEVEILGYEPFLGLGRNFGLARDTRSMEHAALAPFFAPDAWLDEDWGRYFKSFSVVVSYLFDPDEHFETNLRKCGVETLLVGPHKPEEIDGRHAAIQLADPLAKLALFLEPGEEVYTLPGATEAKRDPHRVVVHPGSGSPSKNWGLDSWIELGPRILESKPETELVLVTGEVEEEHGLAGEMADAWLDLPHRHVRAQPLPDVLAELRSASLFVGQDSGVTHLAAVAGVPRVIALFGPTAHWIWAPPHPGVEVVQAPEGRLDLLAVEEVLGRVVAPQE